MKLITRTLFCLSAIALFLSCGETAENKGTPLIQGKLRNIQSDTMVYLLDVAQRQRIDSAEVNANGEFNFYTDIPSTGFYNLEFSRANFATLVLDSTQRIKFFANADSLGYTYKVEGSEENERFTTFNKESMEFQGKMQRIQNQKDSMIAFFQGQLNLNNTEKKRDSIDKVIQPKFDSLSKIGEAYANEARNWAIKFINEKPASFTNIAATTFLRFEEDSAIFFRLGEDLKKKYPTSDMVIKYNQFLTQQMTQKEAQKTEELKLPAGSEAPELDLPQPDGKNLKLSSLRGKVVLIDFWASWCRPCRQENPNVVRVYKRFKNKGFEILGVSLDQDKNAWTEAIKKDGLTWKHISDLRQWESSVIPLYKFNSIPFTVLVDRDGKIIAKNLRGPELELKLEEVFAK